MSKLKPYPKYKDSGVEWLGKIPSGWVVLRNLALFLERNERVGHKDLELLSVTIEKGVIKQSDVESKKDSSNQDKAKYKITRKNDIVYNKMRMWQGAIGHNKYLGMVSPAYIVLKPNTEINPRYYHYLFRTKIYNAESYKEGYGIVDDQHSLRFRQFKCMYSPDPNLDAQNLIVKFLEEKESQINEYIKNLQKEIKLLKEYRQKIISQAVTCGLDENGKLRKKPEWQEGEPVPKGWKDSGVDNIGHVPNDWSDIKLRSIFKSISVKNHPHFPLLSVVREKGVIVRDIEDFEANHNYIPDDLSNYKVVRKGQFAMNKMKAWQGSYGISDYEGIVSPAYYIFDVVRSDIDLRFLHIALRSRTYTNQFGRASQGIRTGQWDLSIPQMKDIQFFYPSIKEQNKIVEYINSKIKLIRVEEEQIKRQIDFMKEYKQSLISKVVTGKVDVRSVNI